MPLSSYGRLCTQVYDLDKPEVPAEALLFYLERLHASGGVAPGQPKGPVLEPMCGSGRFLVPLLELGIDIDGMDTSSDMLAACREKCAARGLTPRLYEQPIESMKLPRKYGFAFIPAGSFGLIHDEMAVLASLRSLYDHLLPGGRLVMEVETPSSVRDERGRWKGSSFTRPDGATILASFLPGALDAASHTAPVLGRYELLVDGRLVETELEEYRIRYYEQDEIGPLLASAGFAGVRTMRVYSQEPPPSDAASFIVECVRPS